MPDVWFPNLGIRIAHVSKVAFSIFGLDIAWYGMIIVIGIMAGLGLACVIAKKTGQKPELYLDFLLYALIVAIIGARLYYVIFSWDYYGSHPLQIFNLRAGGLAIYGGVIGAVLTAVVYTRVKRISFWTLVDTAIPGLALGQAIGRWGNFFNQEAFGSYTDGLFAMRLNVETAAYTTEELLEKAVTVDGVTYIQVHPTFLYESFGCLLLVLIMLLVWKYRKTGGVVFCTYFIGYGILRFFIEGLRTDQLILWGTGIPVSQLLSVLLALSGALLLFFLRMRMHKRKRSPEQKEEPSEPKEPF